MATSTKTKAQAALLKTVEAVSKRLSLAANHVVDMVADGHRVPYVERGIEVPVTNTVMEYAEQQGWLMLLGRDIVLERDGAIEAKRLMTS